MSQPSSHPSQHDAMLALIDTEEEFKLTARLRCKPPNEVAVIQFAMCGSKGPIRRYFSFARRAKDRPSNMREILFESEIVDSLADVSVMNLQIQEETRAFVQEKRIQDDDGLCTSSYVISHGTLERLAEVNKRAHDLFYNNGQSRASPGDQRSHDYQQLRSSVIRFIDVFQLPRLFCDALGLACENLSVTLLQVQTRLSPLENYELMLRQNMQAWWPQVASTNARFISHNGIQKEVLKLFHVPVVGYLFLLKSPSRNPNFPHAPCYDLVPPEVIPAWLSQWLCTDVSAKGDMGKWQHKTKQEFHIKAVAKAPSKWAGLFCLAESLDGAISEDWYADQDYITKWGYERTDTIKFEIAEIKCGQVTERDEHRKMVLAQLTDGLDFSIRR